MAFGTKMEEAANVKTRANYIQKILKLAKEDALLGDFSRLIAFQKDLILFATDVGKLDAHGYTMEVLGPIVVEAYNIDPAKDWDNFFKGQFTEFKIKLSELISLRNSHQEVLYATAADNAKGYIEYKGSLDISIRDEFISKIDSILLLELS